MDKLIKCAPDEKAFEHVTKYYAHPKLIQNLNWSLYPKVLPNIKDDQVGSPQSIHKNYQIIQHLPGPVAITQGTLAGTGRPQPKPNSF